MAAEDDNLIASSAKKKKKKKEKARPALELMLPFKTRLPVCLENCLAVFRWASTIRVIQLAMGSSSTSVYKFRARICRDLFHATFGIRILRRQWFEKSGCQVLVNFEY